MIRLRLPPEDLSPEIADALQTLRALLDEDEARYMGAYVALRIIQERAAMGARYVRLSTDGAEALVGALPDHAIASHLTDAIVRATNAREMGLSVTRTLPHPPVRRTRKFLFSR